MQGKWSEIGQVAIYDFQLLQSLLDMNILSIRVAVLLVILVGFVINGNKLFLILRSNKYSTCLYFCIFRKSRL